MIELNGAVDFDATYSLPGQDVLREAAVALGLLPARTGRRRDARLSSDDPELAIDSPARRRRDRAQSLTMHPHGAFKRRLAAAPS